MTAKLDSALGKGFENRMLLLYAECYKMMESAKASLSELFIMRETAISLFLAFSLCILSWIVSPDVHAANSCLSCHGSADKLKSMIKDEDYNKGSGEGYG